MPLHVDVDIDYNNVEGDAGLVRKKRVFFTEDSRRWREIRQLRADAAREIAAETAARREKLRLQQERIAKLRQRNIEAAVDEVRRRCATDTAGTNQLILACKAERLYRLIRYLRA